METAMSPLAAKPQFKEINEDGSPVDTAGMTQEEIERKTAVHNAWKLWNKHGDNSKLIEVGLVGLISS